VIKKINHIGIAVKDLEKTIIFFQEIYNAKLLWRKSFELQKLESAFVSIGEAQFELSSSSDPENVISKFINLRGEGIHHVSLEVENIDQSVEELRNKGLKIMGEAKTQDFKVAFVHPQTNMGMLMELVELKS